MLSAPASDRVPPLILRLMTKWRRLRSAALLSAGFGFGHEDKEFPVSSTGQALDVALDASAEAGLCRRCVGQVRATDGQQLPFQSQLGGAPPGLGMGEGFGSGIEPVDGVSPPRQWRIIWVEGAQVVAVPQQSLPLA